MRVTALLAAALAASLAGRAAGLEPLRNLVVILGDDIGVGDFGAFGSPNTQTPAINRLAEMGAKLTQFHTQPLCSPSRASMLTARLPIRSGVYTNESFPLDEIFRVFMPVSVGCLPNSEVTIPKWLRNASHAYSALVGKYHCGSNVKGGCTPTQAGGFDYYFGLLNSHEEGFPGPFPESIVFPPMSLHENVRIVEQPTDLLTLTPRYTQRALQIIETVATGNATTPNPAGLGPLSPAPLRGQPFTLFVHYEESHVPLFAAPGYQNTSTRGAYGDMTAQMDGSVAIIMEALERHGLLNSTMVLLSSDNGAWIDPSSGLPGARGTAQDGGSNGPLRGGKGSTWQGGMVNPAIVVSPGRVPAGQVVSTPTTIMDVMPTFAEAAGLRLPGGVTLDGRSFWAHVNGTYLESPLSMNDVATQARQRLGLGPAELGQPQAPPPIPQVHEAIYFWRADKLYAIRQGDYKAHFFTRPGFGLEPATPHDPPLLFDLRWDYGESRPLNTTLEPYATVLANLEATAANHRATVTRGVSQYEDVSFDVVPCCGKPFNETEALMFLERGMPGLALWDACVCNPENAFRPGA
ncbi:hypothetical protein FNF27_06433 [Cafeteria roenbergensis]|uniref:Sulfatase N-terminal domain-containing protein n=1 Tax=Cafeteria roenbergensis TaxID=33653 RepID=A0A5A8DMG7_CAFRO|nr:hypothetical protein FNF28_06904 [Cafeteria roenbergensis]KAA0165797.1 hypothetical protein FNF31_01774 [Cafeteria roenbergensis]KAA0170956.1 hypothetical protein FNF27_06433 [Cafeteria roenbergensis]